MVTTHGFDLLWEREIPELRTRARMYRHARTGAQLLSLENDDENKVFGVAFRTPISDSTGVPHILEHSVLGGSRKYPVKEPFNELAKGSLKTFLNAMTYSDKTVYPIASTNTQDFYNLADVYLDAVFHPRMTLETFQQEGWRFEPEGAAGALVFKGVVLNEMRGAYAQPERALAAAIMQSLFPQASYRFDSGGNPATIPDLTFEQFKAFHQRFYHPSNARLYFYGDDPAERRLALVDRYLSEFDPLDVHSDVPLQPRLEDPVRIERTFATGPDTRPGKQARLTVNWMIGEVDSAEQALALEILEEVLIGSAAAPLRKALIDSGLGEALAGGGLSTHLRQWAFATGLRAIASEDADKVEALVLDTLRSLAERGIDPDTVRAAMNTAEFQLRENNTGQFPRGLSLFIRSLTWWLYDRDPLAPLAFEAPLAALKQRLAAGERVFEDLIHRTFLENTHRTTVLVRPDPEQGPREQAEEQARLAAMQAQLGKEALAQVAARAQELKRLQEAPDPPEALATVPRLALDDLERQHKPIPIAVEDRHGARVLYHDLFTNGIVYLDLGFDLRQLSPELLPYVPLFGRALTGIGTHREDFVRLSQRIGATTGGVHAEPTVTTVRTGNASDGAGWLMLHGKALAGQAGDLLDVMRDVLLDVKLDNQERFRQLVRESKARQETGVVSGGHSVAATRLAARFSGAGWVGEQMRGVSNLLFTRALAERVDSDWPGVLAALEQIRQTLVNRAAAIANVTVDSGTWSRLAPQLDGLLQALPEHSVSRAAWLPSEERRAEGLVIPGQINFVGKGADLYQLGYQYHGSAEVITHYLRRTWLHEQVRMRGGAYGAFAIFDRRSGVWSYVSYRDPNVLATLEKFDQSAQFLRDLELSEDELTKAIIGAISNIDPYLLPDAKGRVSMERYLAGESDESLQRRRDQILGTTVRDFHQFGDALAGVSEGGQVVIVGAESSLTAAASERPNWLRTWSLGL